MAGTGERRRRERLIVTILTLVVMGLAALDSARFFLRLDLTSTGLFSISPVSRKLARELPEGISITYYVSDKLAGRYSFPQQIRDMLGEYAGYSEGKIALAVEDPARAKTPLRLENLGIVAKQMQVIEKQEMNLATVYSGIVIRCLDRIETLPFVTDVSDLEYGISSRIRALILNRERTIGILLGDDRKSLERDYRSLAEELGSKYRVEEVPKGKDIPPNVTVLFVIGNRDLDEYDLLPVDRFVMGGGRALFAVDGVDVDIARGLQAEKQRETAVFDMLAAYGVRVNQWLVLDTGQRISFRSRDNRIMSVRYPHWITVSKRNTAADNPLTSRFAGLDLYWPSPLEPVERQGVEERALVSTTKDAFVMKDKFLTDPALSQLPVTQDAGPRGQYVLAMSLSGKLRSFFEGRRLPARAGIMEKPGDAPAPQSTETRLIVVGDADFASDMIHYTQADYNMDFLSNCAEWLDMQDDLLSIKTRSQTDLRLNAIEDPSAKARVMMLSQILNIAVIPFLVIAFGVLRLAVRRRREGRS